jgi:hypothetical protein
MTNGADPKEKRVDAPEPSPWFGLAKYPVMAVSLILAVGLLRALGVNISELSTNGAKFEEVKKQTDDLKKGQDAQTHRGDRILGRAQAAGLDVLRALDGVKQLEQRVAQLEQGRKFGKSNAPQQAEAGAESLESSMQFSEELTALSKPVDDKSSSLLQGKEGYLWIGNAAPGERLKPANLADLANPTDVTTNREFKVLGNLALRSSMPVNDESYYRGQSLVGVVPRNATVLVLERPKEVRRDARTQWWMKVRVE